IDETARRRRLQQEFNEVNGIIPQTVVRAVMNINPAAGTIDYFNVPKTPKSGVVRKGAEEVDLSEQIQAMRLQMFAAAENVEFEPAARLRDELNRLEALAGSGLASVANDGAFEPYAGKRKKGRANTSSKPTSAPRGYKARQRATRKFRP